MDHDQAALEHFGRTLMKRVRDEAVKDWDQLLTGKMKGKRAERIQRLLANEDLDKAELVQQLVPEIVDTALHYVLWMLEQERSLHLSVEKTGQAVNVAKASDGLAGELYTEDGWILRFSEERYTPPS